jgi:hypothetical protein
MNPLIFELAKLIIIHGPTLAQEIGKALAKPGVTTADIEALKAQYAPSYDSFGIRPPERVEPQRDKLTPLIHP